MKKNDKNQKTRREFLAGGALLGTGLIIPSIVKGAQSEGDIKNAVLNSRRPDGVYELRNPENIVYSACLQCNTGCGIKCKLQNGVLTKIDGNPYSPWTMLPHLPYSTEIKEAAAVDGAICPKGQAGLQTAYDPYRIRKVLKRAGRRGENKWVTIPFDQAIREICEGGKLFASVPGEEDRHVEGLRELVAFRDANLSKSMDSDIKAIWSENDSEKKKALVNAFKSKYADHLDKMIDPDHPDLGPKNNQIVLNWGRVKGGRGDFYRRFAAGLGTVNAHGHTTVCQGSLYFACAAISDQYTAGGFSGGRKFYWQADTQHSRFVLFVGANLFEANYGPTNRTLRLTENLASGKTRIATVDPRFSKLASKSWKWLPIKPGTDAALALGMIRWIIDNKRYDEKFLSCANKAAAVQAGETSWCNGTWLVAMENGTPGPLVRAADIGLVRPEMRETRDGKPYEEKFITAMVNGKLTALDPNDEDKAVYADLFVDDRLADGTHVKSGLQILYDAAQEHSVDEWAEIAGVRSRDLIEVAHELTSYGKQGCVDLHRGPSQHTNGFYGVFAWMCVNMLLGNFDAKGGMICGSTYDTRGRGGLFDLAAHPNKISAFGVNSIRYGLDYEKTTLFEGYPAKRQWYPLSSDIYQEVVPSIGDAYPYPVKALFMYMAAPTYALPAGHTNIAILQDTEKLPLFIANDILIGPTSMYADYIFPDLSYLERWEFHGTHFNIPNKVQPVRQPVIPPIPEECTVYGKNMPICFESMMLGVAEHLSLPGFGRDAFGPGLDFEHPDDLYLRGVANLAFGDKPDGSNSVPDSSEGEIVLFQKSRQHLPSTVYDEKRWKAIIGPEMWPKVVYVLNRGGRFEDYDAAYVGDRVRHTYGALLNLYQEKTARTIHSGTGEPHSGFARFVPIQGYRGRSLDDYHKGYELDLITHRTISQTKSRTITNPWLSPIMPENGIIMHPSDADRLGLKQDQLVKVVSATNPSGEWPLGNGVQKPMVGKVMLTQGIRPGVISFALGFGHWATGACDVQIDRYLIRREERRETGINANAAMWTDPDIKNTAISDPVGGSVSFYDSKVRLEPV